MEPVCNGQTSPIRVIAYSSRRHRNVSDEAVLEIALRATEFNWKNGITGALWFGDAFFYQVMEGAPPVVEGLFEKINRDPRHYAIEIVVSCLANERRYKSWDTHVFDGQEEAAIAELASLHTDWARSANEKLPDSHGGSGQF